MDEIFTTASLTENDEKGFRKAIQQLLDELKQIDLHIEADQKEIHRSQARTQAHLDSLKALL
jgi:hypothetical protein